VGWRQTASGRTASSEWRRARRRLSCASALRWPAGWRAARTWFSVTSPASLLEGVEVAIAGHSPDLVHRAQVQLAARMKGLAEGAPEQLGVEEVEESEDGSESEGSACSVRATASCVGLIDLDVPERVARALMRCGVTADKISAGLWRPPALAQRAGEYLAKRQRKAEAGEAVRN
jgi:hypothetical protein